MQNTEEGEEKYILQKKLDSWMIIDKSILKNPSLNKYHPSVKPLNAFIHKGFMLDLESWYSITPEQTVKLAIKKIERAKIESLTSSKTIFCAYGGVGGDALIFLQNGYDVICSDLVYRKTKYLKHNYQVIKKEVNNIGSMFCMTKDIFEIERRDFVKQPFLAFVTPPWGGIEYKSEPVYNLERMELKKIHEKMKTLTDNMVYFLPRNCEQKNIREAVGRCKIQLAKLCDRDLAFLVYCGPIFN